MAVYCKPVGTGSSRRRRIRAAAAGALCRQSLNHKTGSGQVALDLD